MRSASSSPPGGGRYVETRIGSRFTPGVIALLALYCVTYLVILVAPESVQSFIASYLLLQPIHAIGLRPYQLVVAPAIMTNFISLLFTALLLWSLGSAIEQRAGTRRYLWWMAGASFVAALVAALMGRLLGLVWPGLAILPVVFDAQPVFMASLVAFASYYGTMPVRMWGIGEPISGRGLSYFFVGLGLVADVLRQQWLQLFAELAAVLWMWAVLNRPWRGGLLKKWKDWRKKSAVRRSGFAIIDGGASGGRGSKQRWVN